MKILFILTLNLNILAIKSLKINFFKSFLTNFFKNEIKNSKFI